MGIIQGQKILRVSKRFFGLQLSLLDQSKGAGAMFARALMSASAAWVCSCCWVGDDAFKLSIGNLAKRDVGAQDSAGVL